MTDICKAHRKTHVYESLKRSIGGNKVLMDAKTNMKSEQVEYHSKVIKFSIWVGCSPTKPTPSVAAQHGALYTLSVVVNRPDSHCHYSDESSYHCKEGQPQTIACLDDSRMHIVCTCQFCADPGGRRQHITRIQYPWWIGYLSARVSQASLPSEAMLLSKTSLGFKILLVSYYWSRLIIFKSKLKIHLNFVCVIAGKILISDAYKYGVC